MAFETSLRVTSKWPQKLLFDPKKSLLVSKIAILRACYRARKPPNPENTKKIQISHPGLTWKYGKNTEKNIKTAQKLSFSGRFRNFSVFFLYFRGPTRGGGFCIFFVFSGFGGFSGSVAGPQDFWCQKDLGGVPTTPDPNTSAKVSRYKWEAYRDTNWWCIYYYEARNDYTKNIQKQFFCVTDACV